MDIAGAQEFFRTNHRAVASTFRRDGRPAMSPITVAVDDDGRVLVSTRKTAMKVKHLRRDPRLAICGLNDGFFGEWVQVEGPAEIIEQPEAMDLLIEYYRRAAGEHPDWDEYRAAMERDQRVIVRLTIERAGPVSEG